MSSVPLDEGAAEIEPEARAADAIGPAVVGALEAFEDACLLPRGDADAAIGNTEFGHMRLGQLTERHLDGAVLGAVFERVAEQVVEHSA